MQQGISRRAFGMAATASAVTGFGIIRARGDEPLRLRCSLDTAPSHLRNVGIIDYLAKLEAASGGRIKTELFQSGQLFADLNVTKALVQGQVEMAAPGIWTLTGFVPNADALQLPIFYGRTTDEVRRALEGKSGALMAQELEQKLKVRLLGKFIELGYQNSYTSKKEIVTAEDFRGLKIRSPGGAGTAWRLRFLGAIPNTTAWPDVPLSLSQGTFDGLVSTNMSLVAAKLWEAGVRFGFEDHQFCGAYIPMFSGTFWAKMPPDLQKIATDIWAQNIPTYSANVLQAQREARAILESNGIKFHDPTPEAAAALRAAMVARQDEAAAEIKVSPEMVKLVMQDLGATA
jgi:TRAP-type C4-dicarboxylate transport system substrate-binding protein